MSARSPPVTNAAASTDIRRPSRTRRRSAPMSPIWGDVVGPCRTTTTGPSSHSSATRGGCTAGSSTTVLPACSLSAELSSLSEPSDRGGGTATNITAAIAMMSPAPPPTNTAEQDDGGSGAVQPDRGRDATGDGKNPRPQPACAARLESPRRAHSTGVKTCIQSSTGCTSAGGPGENHCATRAGGGLLSPCVSQCHHPGKLGRSLSRDGRSRHGLQRPAATSPRAETTVAPGRPAPPQAPGGPLR